MKAKLLTYITLAAILLTTKSCLTPCQRLDKRIKKYHKCLNTNLIDTTFHDTIPAVDGDIEIPFTADSSKIDSIFINNTDTLIPRDTVIRWLYNCGQFIKGDTVVIDTDSIQIVSFWNADEQNIELRYFLPKRPVAIPAKMPQYTVKPSNEPVSVRTVLNYTLKIGIPLLMLSLIIGLYKRIRGKKQSSN